MTRKTDRIADILVIDDNDSDIALIRDAINDMAAASRLHAVADAADALAVAICHSHHRATRQAWSAGSEDPLRAASGRS